MFPVCWLPTCTVHSYLLLPSFFRLLVSLDKCCQVACAALYSERCLLETGLQLVIVPVGWSCVPARVSQGGRFVVKWDVPEFQPSAVTPLV